MDEHTSAFLRACKSFSVPEEQKLEFQSSLVSYMHARPRAINAPLVHCFSMLGTFALDPAEKLSVRLNLSAAMQQAVSSAHVPQSHIQPDIHNEDGLVSLFSSFLCGRSPVFA